MEIHLRNLEGESYALDVSDPVGPGVTQKLGHSHNFLDTHLAQGLKSRAI